MSTATRKQELFENLLRVRRASRALPKNDDLADLRIFLESELGETVSQRLAATILGVSHTGLRRWLDSGDLPLVFTPKGRKEVPVGALLSIRESVDEVRSTGERSLHVMEPMVLESRRLAETLGKGFQLDEERQSQPHRNVELLSLAYHQALAKTMRRDDVEEARQVLRRWVKQGRIDSAYATRWELLLGKTVPEIRRAISEDSQEMRDLRQNSPFAGMLSEPERRELVRLLQ